MLSVPPRTRIHTPGHVQFFCIAIDSRQQRVLRESLIPREFNLCILDLSLLGDGIESRAPSVVRSNRPAWANIAAHAAYLAQVWSMSVEIFAEYDNCYHSFEWEKSLLNVALTVINSQPLQ
jgi:hypothetical protein